MTNERPVLSQINIVVRDMEATVAFYRLLGLDVPDTLPEWQAHHRTATMPGGLDLDFDSVEFTRVWDRGWGTRPHGAFGVLGFHVETRQAVDDRYNELTRAGYA